MCCRRVNCLFAVPFVSADSPDLSSKLLASLGRCNLPLRLRMSRTWFMSLVTYHISADVNLQGQASSSRGKWGRVMNVEAVMADLDKARGIVVIEVAHGKDILHWDLHVLH